jgi:Zn-dependent protease with chaperone function
VSAAACLLGYALAVLALAPPLLARVTRAGQCPRLAVAAWLTAMGSVLLAVSAAGALAAADFLGVGNAMLGCVAALRHAARGDMGVSVRTGLLLAVAAAFAAGAAVVGRAARRASRDRARTREHARMVRLAGRDDAALGAVVVTAPQRAAYCIAGRPGTVVITSAALCALDRDELAAVLAHERAHLAGRHHLATTLTKALADALPRLSLFALGHDHVGRLLEMRADDDAARAHGRQTVLRALAAMAGAGPAPSGALGAGTTAVLERACRLAGPPPRASPAQAALALATFSLGAGTVLAALAVGVGRDLCKVVGVA